MRLPVLPLRDAVLFPDIPLPLEVGRRPSTAAVEAAVASEDRSILLVAQKEETDEPRPDQLYTVATRGILSHVAQVGETLQLVVHGLERMRIARIVRSEPYIEAEAFSKPVRPGDKDVVEAAQREVFERLAELRTMTQGQTTQLAGVLSRIKDPLDQAYLLASVLPLETAKRQAVLEADAADEALKRVLSHVEHEAQILRLRHKISQEAAAELSREQREYVLRQQMRAIQDELHEAKPEERELDLLRERLSKTELPSDVRAELERELSRLQSLTSLSLEYQVGLGYVRFALELPWSRSTRDDLDLGKARAVLDDDHFDLKEVKQRIIEHLAVLKLNPEAKAPILCFVGPPGTGKTSLGQSIARALGRRFERMSLGGVHDEAELRGHRRTYVGAMPGRIIQAVRRAGVNNPLLMLDEIDKLGSDYRGDPSSALMEVLDPAQNFSFHDNYLDLPFDLSKVFFITTANTLENVPGPLLDRMEVLRLSGYTEDEKLEIARRYLLPRRIHEAGLEPAQLQVSDAALRRLIRRYTREAGLRQLERALGSAARKLAVRFAEGKTEPVALEEGDLAALLGAEPFYSEQARRSLKPGVAAGLAWTEAGGEVLYVEAIVMPGRGALTMTGNLGGVMKESVQTAYSYVASCRDRLPLKLWTPRLGLHVHVPAGAAPKDGPSAGLAVVTAVASLLSGLPARSDTALTGEITLSGLVLPVGGIKEKALAARRAELKRVVLPKANEKDLEELPEPLRRELELVLVSDVDEALRAAVPGLFSPPVSGDGSPPRR